MKSLPKLLVALAMLAFCWSCAGPQQTSTGNSGKMLTDADYKRIGVHETGDGR